MEKELFITTLLDKAKAANNNAPIDNLSERTINELAGLFLPQFTDDEKITDESWLLPVQTVRTLSGQLRHDTSLGIQTFKSQYDSEQKNAQAQAIKAAVDAAKADWEAAGSQQKGQEAGKQTEQVDIAKIVAEQVAEQMKQVTGEDSELGKLSKQFGEFLKMQAAKEKAATEADVRSQVRDYLIGRGVDEEDFALEYTLEKLAIGDNPDVSALKTVAQKMYEANYKKIHRNDGGQPYNGGNGAVGGSVAQEIEAWGKSRQKAMDDEAAAAAELEKHIFK